jgi:myosin-5
MENGHQCCFIFWHAHGFQINSVSVFHEFRRFAPVIDDRHSGLKNIEFFRHESIFVLSLTAHEEKSIRNRSSAVNRARTAAPHSDVIMAVEMVTGTKCFAPDEAHIWLPATVVSHNLQTRQIQVEVDISAGNTKGTSAIGPIELRTVDFTDKKTVALMSSKSNVTDTLPLRNDDHVHVDDMISLNHLHEAAILYNIKARFMAALPYTYTGNICIAMNPYQWKNALYTDDQQRRYLNHPRNDLPPHVYATSVAAYRGMQIDGRNQSILVNGESGAGKTETTKILMNHLATIAGGLHDTTIEKIIHVSPLLEYFGNAKTLRNDNSSRFGKLTQLQFNANGKLVGATCQTYLLEKTRVVQHEPRERNYHIFYQVQSYAS